MKISMPTILSTSVVADELNVAENPVLLPFVNSRFSDLVGAEEKISNRFHHKITLTRYFAKCYEQLEHS